MSTPIQALSSSERGARALELDQLVFLCLERIELDGDTAIDGLCSEHPEHSAALRARIDALRKAGLLGSGSTFIPRSGAVPETLGDFQLISRLGAGGMGVVYLAAQRSLGRRVALKLIRPEQLYFDGARERFQREVEAVARLSHPGIVPVYSVGEEQGIPYFAMELISGASLSQVIQELAARAPAELRGADLFELLTRLAPDAERDPTAAVFAGAWWHSCFEIVQQVAVALEHAHRRGVKHRDLKPSNVMLTPAGRVLLVDFGLASLHGAEAVTRSGMAIGSLPYLPPENLRGQSNEGSSRAEIYSLGATLYELLTLTPPYQGENCEHLIAQIVAGRAVAPRRRNAAMPSDAETVCMTAIEIEPVRRYDSAQAFARDLANVLASRPIEARPAGSLVRLKRWARRRPGAAAAAALGLLVFTVGPLSFALQESRARERIAAERDEARLQRALADSSFAKAFEAVDLLTEIGHTRLDNVPQADGARRELLQRALEFYRGFVEERRDDPRLTLEVSRAQYRLGAIEGDLGLHAEAETNLRAAMEALACLSEHDSRPLVRSTLQESLLRLGQVLRVRGDLAGAEHVLKRAAELGERALFERDFADGEPVHLALTLTLLAEVLRIAGRHDEALDAAERGRRLLERLVCESPHNTVVRHQLGTAINVIGRMRDNGGDAAAARREFESALSIAEELRDQQPGDGPARELEVSLHSNIGRTLTEERDLEGAVRHHELAVALGERLVADFPTNAFYGEALFTAYNNLGAARSTMGRLDLARPILERLVELRAAQSASHPGVPGYQGMLGMAENNLGGVLMALGEIEDAILHFDRARAWTESALSALPNELEFQTVLRYAAFNTAACLRALGDHAQAAAALDPLPYPEGAEDCLRAAELLSLCAQLATTDGELSDTEREEARAEYVRRACAFLHEAVARGFRDMERLEDGRRWAGIRDEPEFEAVLQSIERAQ